MSEQIENQWQGTGKLKNIRIFTTKSGDKFVTGWLDQRLGSYFADGTGDRQVYVFGINFVSFDKQTVELAEQLDNARQGQPQTIRVSLIGKLHTRLDRRVGIKEADRNAPQLQLVVEEMAVA